MRRMLAAFSAEDADAFGEIFDPHVVMRMAEGWPEPGPFLGREAVLREVDQLRETWDADALRVTGDFIDVGDRVVVRLMWRAVGTGRRPIWSSAAFYTLRHGRVIAIDRFFGEHEQALKAVGLEE